MRTWNASELNKMGAGAYNAVIQANSNTNTNDTLIRLRYEPPTTNNNGNGNSNDMYFPKTSVTLGAIYNKDNNNNDNNDNNKWGKAPPPSIDQKRPIVLVGKGVTYDTGGLNIKTGNTIITVIIFIIIIITTIIIIA